MCRRLLPMMAMMVFLLTPVSPVAAQDDRFPPVPGQSGGKSTIYDLAALVLPPSAFDEPGFGIDTGGYTTIDGDAATINTSNGGSDADRADVRDQLEEAGWQQGYYANLGTLNPDDPSLFALYVYVDIIHFKNADGAEAGFGLVRDANVNAGFLKVRNAEQVGDQSVLSKMQRTLTGGGTSNSVDLLMQTGEFVAELLMIDYSGAKPDDEQLIALGQTQVQRLQAAKTGVGLSQRALLVTGDGVVTKGGYYQRVAGDQIAYIGETPKDLKGDDRFFGDAGVTDAYKSRQTAPSTSGDENDFLTLALYLYLFDATDNVQTAFDSFEQGFAGNTAYDDVTKVRRAPTFGDYSATYSYTYDGGNGQPPASGYRIAVAAGNVMIVLYAESGGDLPQEAVETIMAAAVTCAGKKTACKAIALPDELAA